jgi:hypothetical protein
MPRITVTATILAGQSVSSSIDLSAGVAQFIHMPAGWTPALLSFLVSYNNVDFGDLVDTAAREVTMNILPGTVIKADNLPAHAGYLKFRSGSRAGAVTQTADRTITISVDT